MKTLGIIGGIAPESTIDYYRKIVASYRAKTNQYPSIIINSIDLPKMLGFIAANQLEEVTQYLSSEIERLAAAGATFALFASNTPHIVFDRIQSRVSIPMLSIVDATRDATQKLGVRRVGLIGTRFTMQAGFYGEVFAESGMEVIVPDEDEQTYIHDRYMSELVNATFLDETRRNLLAIINRLRQRSRIEAVILGGTELPLLLRDSEEEGLPFLDTTKIHAEAAVAEMIR